MVAVTLSSTTLTSRAALTRPKSTKRHARLAVRVHAKLETEKDTADKEGVADATENNAGGFLSGVNNVIKSIWPGSDVANAFNDFGNSKSNPAAKMFDADTMSEAERDALKRQYSQPTGLLAALFPVREPHDGLDGIGGNVLEDPTDPSSAQASTPFHNSRWNLNPAAKMGLPIGDVEKDALKKQYSQTTSFWEEMFPKRVPHDHE